jgi:hypothetical protein
LYDATIRVRREAALWRGTGSSYKILVDDEVVGKIGDGETVDLAVPPGKHSLRLKVDWSGTKRIEFSIRAGETRAFSSRPSRGPAIINLVRSFFQDDRFMTLEDERGR